MMSTTRNCFNSFLPQYWYCISFCGNLNSATGSDFLLDLKLNLHSGTQQELTIAFGSLQYIIQFENKDKILKIYSKISAKILQ